MSAYVECRTCLENIGGLNVVGVQAKVTDEVNVLEAIEQVASIRTSENDLLPKYICKKCFKYLQSSITFRRLIISSNNEFKQRLTAFKLDFIDCGTFKDNLNDIGKCENMEKGLDVIKNEEICKGEDKTNIELKNQLKVDFKPSLEFLKKSENLEVPNNVDLKCLKKRCKKRQDLKKNIKIRNKSTVDSNESIFKEKKSLLCPDCGKTFKARPNFISHMKRHNPPFKVKKWCCDLCPKKFSQKSYLMVHKRTHTGEKPYFCEICSKSFSQLASFYVHKRRMHLKEIKGTCEHCGKKFLDKQDLEIHIRQWHTGERPYLCEICSSAFTCNRALQRHIKDIHTEKNPCPKCGKMNSDIGMKKHFTRHREKEQGIKMKKFTCEYCKTEMNFTSRKRHLMKQHKITLYGRGEDAERIPINEAYSAS